MEQWTCGSAYDQWMGRWSALLASEFIDWLAIPSRARWLDVCCGSGVVTKAVTARCAPESVTGVDFSAAQLASARERCALPNVSFQIGDAMALRFEDSIFDVAVCGLGLNFIPEPKRALQEMKRVVRSGGTLAAYVWDYAEGARFIREFWDAAAVLDPDAKAFDQATRFPMCTPDGLRKLFESVDLEQIEQRPLEIVTRFENFDDYWLPLLSGQGSAPGYLATRDQATRNAIRERLRASLKADSKRGIELPARAWVIRGQR
jgi:SAM-dependent methyltransferase